MSKAIMVTGGAGYIGSHACKALAQAGYRPIDLDNLRAAIARRCAGARSSKATSPTATLLDRHAARASRSTAVMHFAAFAYVGESMTQPELYFRNNVVNSLGLFEAMRETGVRRIVFSSTCATYGIPESGADRRETAAAAGQSLWRNASS